jgi:hypothetical protein
MFLKIINAMSLLILVSEVDCRAEEGYANPIFSNFIYNNVHEINSAMMSLPAPVGPFRISCIAQGAAHPYRLMIIIDTLNASYKELDESDERTSPDQWEGNVASVEVRAHFSERDGRPVKSYYISRIPINEGALIRSGTATNWSYMRKRVYYECISRSKDGELLPELIGKMIESNSQRH